MRCLRRFFCSLGLGAFAVLVAIAPAHAAELASPEYQVKAVFLFQVIQYVTWPEHTFASPDAPIEIGVLGENPFGSALDRVLPST
jgi:hypothetical protein